MQIRVRCVERRAPWALAGMTAHLQAVVRKLAPMTPMTQAIAPAVALMASAGSQMAITRPGASHWRYPHNHYSLEISTVMAGRIYSRSVPRITSGSPFREFYFLTARDSHKTYSTPEYPSARRQF